MLIRLLLALFVLFVPSAYAQVANQSVPLQFSYFTPLTGTTVLVPATPALVNQNVIINPAGTLAALTVQLPACNLGSTDSVVTFGSDQVITALTVTAASGSVVGAGSSLALGQGERFVCHGALTTWYRIL